MPRGARVGAGDHSSAGTAPEGKGKIHSHTVLIYLTGLDSCRLF